MQTYQVVAIEGVEPSTGALATLLTDGAYIAWRRIDFVRYAQRSAEARQRGL